MSGRPPADIEFKAGRAALKDKTVTSDARKGYLKFGITPERLICVQWRPRDSSAYEDEYYFAPGDLKFVKVPACKTGRMYYLYFSDSNQREFFWSQEPNQANDANIEKAIKAIETYVPDDEDEPMETETQEPTPQKAAPPTATTTQPLTPVTPTTPTNNNTNTTSQTPMANMDLFKQIFSNFQPKAQQIPMTRILTGEGLTNFLKENEDIRKELAQHLPEEIGSDPFKIAELVRSAQFLNTMDMLDHAIHEGHSADIISQLGFEPALNSNLGAEGFLQNIQDGVNKKKKK
ncbi:hypothetical protein CYY_004340 [Polysphondylium violaceum]|uniref:Adhesion regulating molecule family protein n=1 Tax=Polysphondylium violaceum TaxID=133409 RepID=A0A8J4PYF2_9MYCE|nr:hypothetical protein CYY_004340 [Polysphondylium violaceum]